MLYHHPASLVQGFGDGFRQLSHLREAVFKTDVQVVGVGREESKGPVLLQNGQGTDIDAVVVVGQLQTGEHTPDEGAFARAGFADNTDQLVGGVEIHLRQLLACGVHTVCAAGCIVAAQ